MDLHVKVVAAFHIVLGILGVMGSLMVALMFGGAAGIIRMAAPDEPEALVAVPIVGLVGGMLVLVIFTLAVPSIIAGIGLLKRRPWARILTIVLSVLDLILIPVGTLLGIYGLWVLLAEDTARLFGTMPIDTPDPALPPTT